MTGPRSLQGPDDLEDRIDSHCDDATHRRTVAAAEAMRRQRLAGSPVAAEPPHDLGLTVGEVRAEPSGSVDEPSVSAPTSVSSDPPRQPAKKKFATLQDETLNKAVTGFGHLISYSLQGDKLLESRFAVHNRDTEEPREITGKEIFREFFDVATGRSQRQVEFGWVYVTLGSVSYVLDRGDGAAWCILRTLTECLLKDRDSEDLVALTSRLTKGDGSLLLLGGDSFLGMASLEDGSAVTREYKFSRQGDLQPYFYPCDIAGDDFSLARALSAFRAFFRSPRGQLWAEYFSLPTFRPQVASSGPKYNLDYVRTAFQDAAGNRGRVLHELRSLQRTLVSLFRLLLFLTLVIVAVLVSRFF